MSSGPVGKFQDHYKVFGVDPKASTDEIHAVYRKQVDMYHPERGKMPDREKYEAAQLAFEVLSDPEGRKAFDSVRSGGEDEAECSFSGLSFFTDMREDVSRRNVILIALYDHKRQKPRTPAITRRQLDMLIKVGEEELQLAIWYLKDRGLMVVDDRSKMSITASGMDYLQANLPAIETVLPYLKIKSAETAAATETPVASPEPHVLNLTPLLPPPATNLANLASNLGQSVAPAVNTPALNTSKEPAAVSFDDVKAKPLNFVRRSLKLNS
jgi:hypothetical protein